MPSEVFARRVIAGIKFLDGVTGRVLSGPLEVRAGGRRLVANRRGVYAVQELEGFDEYVLQDEPTNLPTARRLDGEVWDPSGEFLPRAFSFQVPRFPDPNDDSAVTTPLRRVLRRSPSSYVSSSWATVDGSLRIKDRDETLGRALVRLIWQFEEEGQAGEVVLGETLSVSQAAVDRSKLTSPLVGEFTLSVVGLPQNRSSDGTSSAEPVILRNIPAKIGVIPLQQDIVDISEFENTAVAASNLFDVNLLPGRRVYAGELPVTIDSN